VCGEAVEKLWGWALSIEEINNVIVRLGKNTWGIDTGIDTIGISQVSQGIDSIDTRIDSYPKN
jgi:hypothetical protein